MTMTEQPAGRTENEHACCGHHDDGAVQLRLPSAVDAAANDRVRINDDGPALPLRR